MAQAGKSHRKKKSGRKAEKRKNAESKKKNNDGDLQAARKRNPKAFIFSSRGKAKIQQARSAEKDQRRMHGGSSRYGSLLAFCSHLQKFEIFVSSFILHLASAYLKFISFCSACCGTAHR